MIQKTFTPKRTICRVTFKIPSDWAQESVSVVGDFNDWDPEANPLEQKNGAWETLVRLKPENEYKFRYFVDNETWKNDDAADGYEPNEFGTEDSILKIGK